MYGLMRAGICSSQRERAQYRRLHYCGACKTIGRLYGQPARLLLNNDAVFLGELLTALSPDSSPTPEWDRSFQSYNCLYLPEGEEQMPLALQLSATATLVMSEFKVADQVEDGGSKKWKLAQRVYSQSFCDASRRMKDWGFPLAQMWELYRTQRPREAEAQQQSGSCGVIQTLEFVAEPTSTVTGWTFRHGVAVVGASTEVQQTMYSLGCAFGRLVYVLDALEDYENDLKQGDFNALQAAFDLPQDAAQTAHLQVPDSCRATVEAYLNELAAQAVKAMVALPLPADLSEVLVARLQSNLGRRLHPNGCAKCGPAPTRFKRLLHAVRAMVQMPIRRPVYGIPGGGGLVHATEVHNHPEPAPTHVVKVQRRRRDYGGGGCGCGGCGPMECCIADCCAQVGCECCCSALAEGGGSCCCEACGSGCACG